MRSFSHLQVVREACVCGARDAEGIETDGLGGIWLGMYSIND